MKNEGESGGTTHRTQLNTRDVSPWMGGWAPSMAPIEAHATSNDGTKRRVLIFRRLHSTQVKLVRVTSYPQKVEANTLEEKNQKKFTVAKCLLATKKTMLVHTGLSPKSIEVNMCNLNN